MQPKGSQLLLFAHKEAVSYVNLCFNKCEIKFILPFPIWRHHHFPLFITSSPSPWQPRCVPGGDAGCRSGKGRLRAPKTTSRFHTRVTGGTNRREGRGGTNASWEQNSLSRGCSWQRMLLAAPASWSCGGVCPVNPQPRTSPRPGSGSGKEPNRKPSWEGGSLGAVW